LLTANIEVAIHAPGGSGDRPYAPSTGTRRCTGVAACEYALGMSARSNGSMLKSGIGPAGVVAGSVIFGYVIFVAGLLASGAKG
jgi:hypothetical protein